MLKLGRFSNPVVRSHVLRALRGKSKKPWPIVMALELLQTSGMIASRDLLRFCRTADSRG